MAWPFTDSADHADVGQECADTSRGTTARLEQSAHPPVTCGTVGFWALPSGKIVARRMDCRRKACPKCGPRVRATYAAGYAQLLEGLGVPVYRTVIPDHQWRRLQTRLSRGGHERLRIPAPDGMTVCYTTAPGGQEVTDLAGQLEADCAAMPSDQRRLRASKGWTAAYQQLQPEPKAPDGDFLGVAGRSFEHVRMVADGLGLLVGEAGDHTLILQQPELAVWEQFCRLVRLYPPGKRREERAA